MNLEDGKTLLLMGVFLMAVAAVVLLIGIICFVGARKHLAHHLEAEYGKKRH